MPVGIGMPPFLFIWDVLHSFYVVTLDDYLIIYVILLYTSGQKHVQILKYTLTFI